MNPQREHATNNRQTYFVTSTTWGRRSLFHAEPWARLFLESLQHYRSSYLLHEFVLMPDHFHLLITPNASLERAVQFIKGGFSRRASLELKSNIEIWQPGFSDHRIRDAEDYARHVRYVRDNPVKRRLVTSAAEYQYSSAYPGFDLDEPPQGLKPLSSKPAIGTAEAVPFQRRKPFLGERI